MKYLKFYAGTKNSIKTNGSLCINDINTKVPKVGYKECSLVSSIFFNGRGKAMFSQASVCPWGVGVR